MLYTLVSINMYQKNLKITFYLHYISNLIYTEFIHLSTQTRRKNSHDQHSENGRSGPQMLALYIHEKPQYFLSDGNTSFMN